MHLQWTRVLTVLAALTLATLLAKSLSMGSALEMIIDVLLLGVCLLFVWFGPLLESQDRERVVRDVMAIVGGLRPA